ncbi:PadR family transcriptional regulator [Microbacterium sp.]|uniref:PadR family transcriptional regulator n=1 Tax=Microbacterium sp. TaxID=51671 RepID=UPI00281154CA|nr:PadR family transcriptional regulator [Microbacterium sp.]
MSVRHSLLAILDQGPCYGYQLRTEFDRRTGSTWPLNVGQIYNTLERLERDGMVAKGDVDVQGHVYYRITDAGRREVRDWLDAPVTPAPGTRDELTMKLALAATLPGVDAATILQRQHSASVARLEALTAAAADERETSLDGRSPSPGEALARQLVADSLVFRADAEVRWLEHVVSRLREHSPQAVGLRINTEKPRRGRPPRTRAAMAAASGVAPAAG